MIDQLDRVSSETEDRLLAQLNEAHMQHPNLRSIVISRVGLPGALSDQIKLGGVDEREFFLLASKIAEETGVPLRLQDIERLQEISRGHAATTAHRRAAGYQHPQHIVSVLRGWLTTANRCPCRLTASLR